MSADYWNLTTMITCPSCGKRSRWRLTTHFMGETGSYSHYYARNEVIPELLGVSVLLDGRIDAFRGTCPHCDTLFEIGARIVRGRVTRVWIIAPIETRAIIVSGAARGKG
jgi:hypothetical protein